jgi:flagellar FliL protein
MASKQEAPEAKDGEDAGTEGAAETPKGLKKFLTRKMLMILVPGLLLVLGAGGGGAYFLLAGGDHPRQGAETEQMPTTPPKVAFSDMADILVNIQSDDGSPAYLKLSVSLELDDEEHKAAIQPLMPRITDQFQAYLRELRLDDLKGSAGVLRLKEELLRRVNAAAAPYHVRDVLLKEMIVQ